MSKKRIIMLDASAFIAGFDPFSVDDNFYSVPSVGRELVNGSLPRLRFDAAMERGKLKVLEPGSSFLNMVKEISKEIGDIRLLSQADMEILALAMQLKEDGYAPTIATDDYSIQNVARKINVDFTPLMTFGIRYYLHWLLYCPACHKQYPSDYPFERCEICGIRLKRKPLNKKPVTREGETKNSEEQIK